MATPQVGIFNEECTDHYFLEYNLAGGWDRGVVTAVLRAVRGALPEGVGMVMGFGPECLEKLAPSEMPEYFIPFHAVVGKDDRIAPGTQADVFFWLMGTRRDLNLQAALDIHGRMKKIATLELEVQGFRYLDKRDLGGFIDGTENPEGDEQRQVGLVPEGQPGAGGSFVLAQKWVHDLDAFWSLEQTEQEHVIGRTKPDSVELDNPPENAHISRTDVKIDGSALKIYRRSAPFGDLREHGLYFIAFSSELMRFAIMLDRMFGLADDGVVDALTGFSTPVSGSYWFAPSLESLDVCLG